MVFHMNGGKYQYYFECKICGDSPVKEHLNGYRRAYLSTHARRHIHLVVREYHRVSLEHVVRPLDRLPRQPNRLVFPMLYQL